MDKMSICALMLSLSGPAVGGQFYIKNLPAELAINEFSRQSDIQVLYDFTLINGRRLNDIEGDMPPAEALRVMLYDTGLSFEFVNDHTLSITAELPAAVDSATLAKWLSGFDGVAISYPYNSNTAPAIAVEAVLPTGDVLPCITCNHSVETVASR